MTKHIIFDFVSLTLVIKCLLVVIPKICLQEQNTPKTLLHGNLYFQMFVSAKDKR